MSKKIYQNPIMYEPTWLCVHCDRTFVTCYSLRRHMRLVHKAPKTLVKIDGKGVRRGEPAW
jgi:hypothetical protein